MRCCSLSITWVAAFLEDLEVDEEQDLVEVEAEAEAEVEDASGPPTMRSRALLPYPAFRRRSPTMGGSCWWSPTSRTFPTLPPARTKQSCSALSWTCEASSTTQASNPRSFPLSPSNFSAFPAWYSVENTALLDLSSPELLE